MMLYSSNNNSKAENIEAYDLGCLDVGIRIRMVNKSIHICKFIRIYSTSTKPVLFEGWCMP